MAAKPIIPNLASVDEVDQVLARLAENRAEIQIIEAEFYKEVNRLRDKLFKRAGARYLQVMKDEKDLQEFAQSNKKTLFADNRSIVLGFGEVGFRKSGDSIEIKDKNFTVKKIKEIFKRNEIELYVKTEETPIKTALKNLADDILKKIGARRENEDQFFYKLKEEKFK